MRELDKEELGQVSGGKLSSENPGGQPNGASAVTENNGGNDPKGQNKDLPPGIYNQTFG
jgi:hypothetical protein